MSVHGDLPRRGSWHSQPVVWLGIAVFAVSLAGCLWLIIVGARYDDQAVDTGHQVFGVPTHARPGDHGSHGASDGGPR